MTARKHPERARAAATEPTEANHTPERADEASDALGSPRRRELAGWFGLFLRACVYVTAALCVELLLAAFERGLTDE